MECIPTHTLAFCTTSLESIRSTADKWGVAANFKHEGRNEDSSSAAGIRTFGRVELAAFGGHVHIILINAKQRRHLPNEATVAPPYN